MSVPIAKSLGDVDETYIPSAEHFEPRCNQLIREKCTTSEWILQRNWICLTRMRVMPKMRLPFVAIVSLAGLVASDARAAYITIEPDDYAHGILLSNVNPLVTLSTFRNYSDTSYVPTFSGVYAADCYAGIDCATTGTKVFRDGFGGDDRWGAFGGSIVSAVGCFQSLMRAAGSGCDRQRDDRFNVMLMSIAAPADSVAISGAFWAQDNTYLYGFDESFNLVGGMSYNYDSDRCGPNAITDWCRTTVTLRSDTGGIRYVLAGGWSNGTSLDNLRVGVPEPGTLALLALGLAGMGLCRRSRASKPRDELAPGIPCSASR